MTLAEALPIEQARCRGILEHAREIGSCGALLCAMLRQSLAAADRACAEGDVVAMIQSLGDLQSYSE